MGGASHFCHCFCLSVIATLNATRLYQATSKVAIFPENPNVLALKIWRIVLLTTNTKRPWRLRSAILRSDALAPQSD